VLLDVVASLSQLPSPLTGAIAKTTAASTTDVAASSQKDIVGCSSHRLLCWCHCKATAVLTNDVSAS